MCFYKLLTLNNIIYNLKSLFSKYQRLNLRHVRGMKNIMASLLIIFVTSTSYSKTVAQIKSKIQLLNPKIKSDYGDMLSLAIYNNANKYKINPDIFLALLMQESTFIQSKISTTGDISVAQINYRVWSKELKRLKIMTLDKGRLHRDPVYAINVMGIILDQIKSKYANRERLWFTRYHSNTIKRRIIYTNSLTNHSAHLINPWGSKVSRLESQ